MFIPRPAAGGRPPRPLPRDRGASPSHDRRLRVALLCSGRAPGLAEWLSMAGTPGPVLAGSRRGHHEVVVCLTTDPGCRERERLGRHGIPCLLHDIRAHYEAAGRPLGDLGPRRDFDRETVRRLRPFRPDLVVACGYLHILTEPMLSAYPGRIVNLHDADLTVRDPDGAPRYPGLHAVREAVFHGAAETRSTAHLVTEEVDGGPPLVLSWSFPVHRLVREARRWGAEEILKAYAYAHREWMMRASWGAILARTVELFARDAVHTAEGRGIVDGAPGPEVLRAPDAEVLRAPTREVLRAPTPEILRAPDSGAPGTPATRLSSVPRESASPESPRAFGGSRGG